VNSTFTSEFIVPANHPSLPGHFPGQPIVPAVVLLDAVLATIRAGRACALQSIPVAKFLQPVLPDERIELRIQFSAMDGAQSRVSFKGFSADRLVFEGSFMVSTPRSTP
jgi:3-hydroxyacyl-[acyl-carrier-protein] dehydratase